MKLMCVVLACLLACVWQDNISNVDALKTCCGILAILSRDESNKLQIARDGIRLIVAIMEMHIGRHRRQAAGAGRAVH